MKGEFTGSEVVLKGVSREFSFRHSWIQGRRRYHQNWVSLSLSSSSCPLSSPSLLTPSCVNKNALGDKCLNLLGSKPAGNFQTLELPAKRLCASLTAQTHTSLQMDQSVHGEKGPDGHRSHSQGWVPPTRCPCLRNHQLWLPLRQSLQPLAFLPCAPKVYIGATFEVPNTITQISGVFVQW